MKRIAMVFIVFALLFVTACSNGVDTSSEQADVSVEESSTENHVTPVEDFEWEDDDGGIKITAYKGSAKRVVVPEIINNKKVVKIGNTFTGNVIIEELIILSDEVQIAPVKGCEALKYLEIRGSRSGSYHIEAPNLKKLVMPNTTTLIVDRFPESVEDLIAPNVNEIVRLEGKAHNNINLIISSDIKYKTSDRLSYTNEFETGHPVTEITSDNVAEIYCGFFEAEIITVNGTTYKK